MWPGQTIGTFDFTYRRRVTLNPCISSTNQHFEKKRSVFGLGSWECIPKISDICHEQKVQKWPWLQFVFLIPKNHLFSSFFCVFSGTAPELMVPAKPPNTHPKPHLMQKEPTDLLDFPRRCTISGVQNVTLYYKIDIVIQLFCWIYKWSLAQGLYKTLDLLFLFPIEPEISTPEKIGFVQ